MMKLILMLALFSVSYCSGGWNTSCPESCKCLSAWSPKLQQNLNTVNCSYMKLQQVPRFPNNTQRLLLAGNYLQHWNIDNGGSIVELDLSNNGMKSVDLKHLGHGLSNLKSLLLQGNKLSSFDRIHLLNLPNLVHLNLSDNLLVHVSQLKHPKLRDISLKGNRLSYLTPDVFALTTELEHIDLSHNELTEVSTRVLPKTVFKLDLSHNDLKSFLQMDMTSLLHLTDLDISYNKLVYFTASQFKETSIEVLKIDGNPIYSITADHFHELPHLMELSITDMPQLRIVGRHSFNSLPSLKILYLNDNPKLSFVHDEAIKDVPELSILFLHNCHLKVLTKAFVKSLPKLRYLSFYNNRIHCNCHMEWVQSVLKNNESLLRIVDGHEMKCSSPQVYKDFFLDGVDLTKDCKPVVTELPSEKVTVDLGDEVTLPCYVNGATKVYWISPDEKVYKPSTAAQKESVHETSLHIPAVKRKDKGTYKCIAEGTPNQQDTTSIYLDVLPETVNVRVTTKGPSFVIVSWNGTMPHTNDHYITYKPTDTDEPVSKYSIDVKAKQYTITDLKCGTRYTVCIVFEKLSINLDEQCLEVETKSIAVGETKEHSYIQKKDIIVAVVSSLSTIVILVLIILVTKVKIRQRKSKIYSTLQEEISVIQPLHIPDKCYQPTTQLIGSDQMNQRLLNNDV